MLSFVIAAPLILSLLSGSASATSCNATTPCPSSAPCCSEFGFCGTDSFCLGGCNPMASYSLDSCKPNPVCKSMTHTFKDTSRILSNSTYFNGNASEYDWVLDKGAIFSTSSNGGELVMTLTKDNGGTRISSTRYLHYGTVTARMKVGRWNGVVTAFISMSDVKDEIDWEFPGDTTSEGQTNFFWQGYIPTGANNGGIEKGLSDTFANYHDFTIDWQPKTLNFLIDGKVVRSVKQSDQVANGVSRYPNTPSRIQLSLWPAGIEGSPQGTVQWAGGMINWNDPDYASAGHFYALVNKITVKCADPQAPSADITSYKYGTNTSANTPNVFFSNQTTLLNNAPPTLATALTKRSAWALAAAGTLASFLL